MAEDPLAAARQALERGEYGLVLALLDPLTADLPAVTPAGADLRLLMATALMGLGQEEKAAACCRSLRGCTDPQRRAQARDLLMVLEAPALRRPRDWSLTLPPLPDGGELDGRAPAAVARRRRVPPPGPPPPPVGTTRAPLGFTIVVAVVLLLLAGLLGGCVEVRTDLRFEGPGRLQIGHSLHSVSGRAGPWQKRFTEALENGAFRLQGGEEAERLVTPVLPAAAALAELERSLTVAASLGGVTLPPPQLTLRERNWLVGVVQEIRLQLDLTPLPAIAGLDLQVRLLPLRTGAVRTALPLPVRREEEPAGRLGRSRPDAVLWPLRSGSVNRLEAHCWRWNPLGLGAVAIAVGLVLVLLLQGIRRRLGFGLPELPA
jgi:hypothetical protein